MNSKLIKNLIIIFILLVILFLGSFLSVLNLETGNMSTFTGNWIDVYYDTDKSVAQDVFDLVEKRAEILGKKLGFTQKQNIRLYIYDKQFTMQSKKYGLLIPLLGLNWYIGDNIGTNVILTSPKNPGKLHDYNSIKEASLHEIVHAYISVINKKIRLWDNEGIALYLTNGDHLPNEKIKKLKLPDFDDLCTSSPIHFADIGGYSLADNYIEYLDKKYGWNKILELIRNGDYQNTFGKSALDIYNGWIYFIKNS